MGRRGWKSRPAKPTSRKKIWLIAIIICLIFSMQSFVFIEKNMKPHLMSVAKVRIKQIATESINSAISMQIANSTDIEHLVDWKMDTSGKVSGFMLNYVEHMRITSQTVEHVEQLLKQLSTRKEYVPLGQAMGSAILASYGPDIPIKFVPEGSAKVDLLTRQKDAGINMLLVEVYMRIAAEVTIIIPFDAQPELVSTEIPISYMLVVGDVPKYYFDYQGRPLDGSEALPPSIALPSPSITDDKDITELE